MDPATYEFEVRYFRTVLRISYESGRRLRVRGVITPDAFTSDGRALYLTDPGPVRQVQERIHAYRNQIARSRHNLCPKNLASA